MRKVFLFISFAFSIVGFSQNPTICGGVQYVQTINLGEEDLTKFKLSFNQEVSLYEEMNVKKSKGRVVKEEKKKGTQFNVVSPRNNTQSEFFYNDKKSFYYRSIVLDEVFFVKDDGFSFQWHLGTETKQIGRFLCQKATTHFRGRDYTAWFTPEIPVSFGPWKFRGLSGLILEVYDKDCILHIVAKDVQVHQKETCKIEVDKSQFPNALGIYDFRTKMEELMKEKLIQMYAKVLPKGRPLPDFEEECEDCRGKSLEIFDEK